MLHDDAQASALCLPQGYQPRHDVESPEADLSHSRDGATVYAFAAHLLRHSGCRYVIDISLTHHNLLMEHVAEPQMIVVGSAERLTSAKAQLYDAHLVQADLNRPFTLPNRWVKHAIVVCHGALERLADPRPLLETLSRLCTLAPYVLIAAPDRERTSGVCNMGPPLDNQRVREWTLGELTRLVRGEGMATPYVGYIDATQTQRRKAMGLILTGCHTVTENAPKKRVCAIVAIHNDVDIVRSCFDHLQRQGVDVCFVDDWSTDGTWEIICGLYKDFPNGCVHIERRGDGEPTPDFENKEILERKAVLAQQLDYDWFVHQDADELRYAPQPDLTLAQAIAHVDMLGFNAIDHTVLDFRPTDNDFDTEQDLSAQFTAFEFSKALSQIPQVKTFKRQRRCVDLASSGGHDVAFPGRRIFPLNFQISHYAYRNTSQARKKIFQTMLPRIKRERDALGWHTHFEHDAALPDQPDYIWSTAALRHYSPLQFNSEFLVERLSRVGLT